MLGAGRRYQHARPARRQPLRHRARVRGDGALAPAVRAGLGDGRHRHGPRAAAALVADRAGHRHRGVVPRGRRPDSARARYPARVFARAGGAASRALAPRPHLGDAGSLLVRIRRHSWRRRRCRHAGPFACGQAARIPPEHRFQDPQAAAPRPRSTIGKAAEAIKDIEKQAAPERPPMPVKETPASAFEALGDFLAPVAKPAAMTLAVIVFTVLFLLNLEAMRERLIGLLGIGRINATTRAMGEASYRVSRYLGTQFIVNAMFGIPFGIALWLIGIPNALLFGLLGMVMRFVPYVGVWIAAAMPIALSFAISDGWAPVVWTAGVFVVLELLLAYVVEPWLYGKSAGLSPIAI